MSTGGAKARATPVKPTNADNLLLGVHNASPDLRAVMRHAQPSVMELYSGKRLEVRNKGLRPRPTLDPWSAWPTERRPWDDDVGDERACMMMESLVQFF